MANFCIPFPEADEWGTPLAKMPNCPNCGDDELGMLSRDRAVCYRCSAVVTRHVEGRSITAVPAVCQNCPWMGTVGACEPDDDGELRCPQCLRIIVVKVAEPR